MLRSVILSVLSFGTLNAAASDDLKLPGERWLTAGAGYVCENNKEISISTPDAFADINLKFDKLSTDYSLDNVLLTATFDENGEQCRYSAILFADNAARTIRLVESKSYGVESGIDCVMGQSLLDHALEPENDYLYWRGSAKHVTILIDTAETTDLCTEHSRVGLDFIFKGRKQ